MKVQREADEIYSAVRVINFGFKFTFQIPFRPMRRGTKKRGYDAHQGALEGEKERIHYMKEEKVREGRVMRPGDSGGGSTW
jgi:hypothetical protein